MSQNLAVPGDEAVEPLIEFVEEFVNPLGIFFRFMNVQDGRAHSRCQGQGDEGRNEDRHGNGQGELAIEDTAHAADKGDRNKDRRQDAGNADNRVLYVFHGDDRRLSRTSGVILDFIFDGFDNDDGIVDEETDGQNHGEQGQGVNREVEDFKESKGPEKGYRDGDQRNEGRPAAL